MTVIGAGPAGLAAAEILAGQGCAVTLCERMKTPGRKLLIAGRGGLNLSHSEPPADFIARYGDAAEWLAPSISAFDGAALRAWAEGLGQELFVGSSGRIFPRAMKASGLLRAWLARLRQASVVLHTECRWLGWNEDGSLRFSDGSHAPATPLLLALGGASWQRLGSDGAWADLLAGRGVVPAPFLPSNCGMRLAGPEAVRRRFAGLPIQHVALSHGDQRTTGDLVLTERGIEGGALYPLAARLREAIARDGRAVLHVDLRPDQALETLRQRLARVRARESVGNTLRKALSLSPQAVHLLRELSGGTLPRAPAELAARVKDLRLELVGTDVLDRAISTAGGVRSSDIDADFMLRTLPGVFVAGEMLDWEAPTGGYLLHASIATGRAAAGGLLKWAGVLPPRLISLR